MPKRVIPLSEVKIRTAKPGKSQYKLFDEVTCPHSLSIASLSLSRMRQSTRRPSSRIIHLQRQGE
jgi:hypothetical protein